MRTDYLSQEPARGGGGSTKNKGTARPQQSKQMGWIGVRSEAYDDTQTAVPYHTRASHTAKASGPLAVNLQ